MTLTLVLAELVVMLECMEPAADVVFDARQIAASKVYGSHNETSHHLVEERECEVSDLWRAAKDVSGTIRKHARRLCGRQA
jgi:hypothetical protein